MTASSDFLGNPVSEADAEALAAVDEFVAGFIGYETRAGNVVRAAKARPEHGLLNLYAGVLFMLLESPEGPGLARPFLDLARAAGLNERERRTAAFLAAWIGGDIPAAQALGEAIAADWPRDLVMVKLSQYLAFTRGDFPRMLRIALAALPAAADEPRIHGMAAFGYEQCHLLADAERSARRALEMRRAEPWAQHALAHVMLTQGRIDEGARFLEDASATWDGLNSFMVTHNWWHLGLFYLSQGRGEAVLRAYDDHCWRGDRDYSQDQVGAVSLLARAELAGIDVGDRWDELAERIAARGVESSSRSWRCSTSTPSAAPAGSKPRPCWRRSGDSRRRRPSSPGPPGPTSARLPRRGSSPISAASPRRRSASSAAPCRGWRRSAAATPSATSSSRSGWAPWSRTAAGARPSRRWSGGGRSIPTASRSTGCWRAPTRRWTCPPRRRRPALGPRRPRRGIRPP
jgi:hypothetical protein